jgi:hypothetical protein
MQPQPQRARSVTDEAHVELERQAVAAIRTGVKVARSDGGLEPRWWVASALWRSGAANLATRAATAYVDAIVALAPTGPPRIPAPAPLTRDEFVVPIASRLAESEGRSRVAARAFARRHGIALSNDRVEAFRRQALAVEAARVAHDAAVGAWRDAARARMAQLPDVLGWRRVAEPGACGACLALMDGSVHPAEEDMVVHTRDRCIAEPVVLHVNDQDWGRPRGHEIFAAKTPAEQDATFHGRGGAAKAQLIRDGRIDFADLAQIATERLGQTNVALAETPLVALQAQAA